MSICYDPSLTMGQRIMNHKYAKMSIFEFLGIGAKKPKKMTHEEAERERWERLEKMSQESYEREQKRRRTSNEWHKISLHADTCRRVMFMLADEFRAKPEWDEAWKAWVLSESASVYLPLCYGDVLRKMKADNKYLPSIHMLLI